jgi:opacity protein-like surface antigen
VKRIVFSLILLFGLAQFCWGESFWSKEPKTKVGLSFSVSVWDSLGIGNIEGGLGLKYRFSDAWIGRAVVGMGRATKTQSGFKEENSNWSLGLRIERHFPQKKFFSPYLGAGLGYLANVTNISNAYYSYDRGHEKTKEYGFPLTLFLGIECYPVRRISLSIEYKGCVSYQQTTIDYYGYKRNYLGSDQFSTISAKSSSSDFAITIYF